MKRYAASAAAMLFLATSLGAQVDQHALADQILHAKGDGLSQAVARAQSLGRQNTGPELREALIAVLDRNNRSRVESPEAIAQLAHVVSQLHDPRAIPVLAGALGTSGSTLVRDALADFGERSAGDVRRVVAAPDSRYEAVNEGLIALRFLVEGRGEPRLSSSTRDSIRQVTRQRLSGKQYFTSLWYAIDLAIALGDAELRGVVDSLAGNRAAVVARGIQEPDLIQRTQDRAAARLRGVPASPKYRSLEERDALLGGTSH